MNPSPTQAQAQNEQELEPYRQIFSAIQEETDLRHAIARAVRRLRQAFEKEDNRAVTEAHVRNLTDLDPGCLAMAYALAEKICTYWPSPGQIRELTGWTEESEGGAALQWVFGYLKQHGAEGRSRGGGVHFGEDESGRRVLLETEPVVAAPEIPTLIGDALRLLGCGSREQGLRYLSQHPAVKGWNSLPGDADARSAERLEGQWMRSYLRALRSSKTDSLRDALARRTQ